MIHNIFSTLPTFKNLHDLKLGLNVLLAQKTVGASSKQTRNRAGKTSLIEMVHFLMGAEAGTKSIFREPEVLDYSFGLDFNLRDVRTVVVRSGIKKAKIFVTTPEADQVKFSATDWCTFLGQQMFGLSSLEAAGSKPPSFRSLFAYFVRREASGAFTTPEKHATMQGSGDMQMALMFLLGLDWQIALDWQVVRDREKTLEELRKAAGTGAFGSIIGKAADLRTMLTLQKARLKRLHAETENFQVLPEYRELETESTSLTRQLNDLTNANMIDFAAIRDLESALASEIPPDLEDLQAVYQEAGVALPGLITRRYEDVKSFHESVVRNRKDYLASEHEAAKLRMDLRDTKKAHLDQRRGEIMGILSPS